jgi:glycosyltransferase involved in cell wall biosynthesis
MSNTLPEGVHTSSGLAQFGRSKRSAGANNATLARGKAISFDNPIRVCFVIDRLIPGGTELHLVRLIESLDRRMVAPYLCLLDGEDPVSRSMEPCNCPVIRLGITSLLSWHSLHNARQFADYLSRERITIVQTYFPDSTYFGSTVGRFARVPYVLRTRRNVGHWVTFCDRWMGRLLSCAVSGTIANCEAARAAVIRQEWERPNRCVVIRNGVDLERFSHIPPGPASADPRLARIGLVANLRPVKAPGLLLAAAAQLRTHFPSVTYHVAGLSDDHALSDDIRRLGLEERFFLHGSLNDVAGLLSLTDVAVLTSRAEGLSNTLLEYMAAGRPIVATAVGGNVELVKHGETGLLIPPDDPTALADAVRRLLSDLMLGKRLGTAAREQVIKNHSREAETHFYETLYCDLVTHGFLSVI